MQRLTEKALRGGYIHKRDVLVADCLDKLGALEDAEEQGKLLRLPCKIGDTIYKIPSKVNYRLNVLNGNHERNKIYEQKVYRIEVAPSCLWYATEEGMDGMRSDNYKKTWFLTKAEAEEALEKMKGEEHE